MMVMCARSRRAIVTELIDTGNELDAALCSLYKGNITPAINGTDTLDTYTTGGNEADFTGYSTAGTLIVWTGAFSDAAGTAYALGQLIEFAAAAPTPPAVFVPNLVRGYFLWRGTDLISAERFLNADGSDAPQPVEDEFGVCNVIPRFSFGQ